VVRQGQRREGGLTITGTDRKFGIAEILLIFSVLVLVIVVAVPIVLIFWNAVVVDGGLNIAGVVKVLSEPDVFQAVVNSLVIAFAVTVVSTVLGVLLPGSSRARISRSRRP
jgi:ABC-type sulfate transport system permease component